jgi:hypothetical protein
MLSLLYRPALLPDQAPTPPGSTLEPEPCAQAIKQMRAGIEPYRFEYMVNSGKVNEFQKFAEQPTDCGKRGRN